MKTNINWNNIRVINGSQNEGFEELVCQLAAREFITGKVSFTRIGKPDGGKECVCELTNGDVQVWQAKYFTSTFSSSQWSQIDESVKTAINNHPLLTKYYVCTPLDMPDGKVKGRKSLLDKWNEKVSEWQQYATAKGMKVEFEYWGSHELISRLSRRKNEGMTYFWFNQEEFEDSWFEYKNNDSIQALGGRYSQELNFELPISKVFSGLSRDRVFVAQFKDAFKKVLDKHRYIRSPDQEVFKKSTETINLNVSKMTDIYKGMRLEGVSRLDFDSMIKLLQDCRVQGGELETEFYRLRDLPQEKTTASYNNNAYSLELSSIREFASAVEQFEMFLSGEVCSLANSPFLILMGEAGSGKSHLLADIVAKRAASGQQSLFILGENLSTREMPWTQILHNILRKQGIDELSFLGSLNAKAEAQGSRILVVIDAINEGEGRIVWTKRLGGFINAFENFPWLGLVVSIRNSFVELIAPDTDIDPEKVVKVEHNGFSEQEYEASREFFKHYGIVQPSSPLLNPEFQNPLFLKLYCQALSNRGLTQVPSGHQGITTIIDSFLESVDIKLSAPSELHYDEKKKLVHKAVEAILKKMVETENDHVDYNVASDIIDDVFRNSCANQEPFLKRLISEGVFNVDLSWDDSDQPREVIYFAYQRFQDHLTVSMLLDKHLDAENPIESFKSGKLTELLKTPRAAAYHQNIIDALSIQLPERIGMELFEVAEYASRYNSVALGFVNSLIWRREDTIKDNVIGYVNDVLTTNEFLFSRFLDVTISTSMKEAHFFNAERLHRFLVKFEMPVRDKIWTIWLQDKFGPDSYTNAVKRLIDWAWNEHSKSHVSDRSVELGCIALSWFLTSSNRYLRDGATKGLVCLLQDRQHLLIALLERFKDVNDPYVLERLYAAVYGSALRCESKEHLPAISTWIYATIFCKELVYPHYLLRDYARGVIENAVHCGLLLDIDLEKVRPAYKSEPLPSPLPSNEEIDAMHEPAGDSGNYGRENWGATAIFSSMTTEYGRGGNYGDFGRYVFGYAFDDFNIDADCLSNYAIQRIFEMGYDPKLFSEFDSNQSSGRGGGHKERIGKKYQWIAFFELLARVSDQCELYDEAGRFEEKVTAFQGPWHPDERDIDPTLVISGIVQDRFEKNTVCWMAPVHYEGWSADYKTWASLSSDLPDPKQIVQVTDDDGDHWLVLETQPVWNEEGDIFRDRWDQVTETVWYQVRSYLVATADLPKFKQKFKKTFYRNGLPEARYNSSIFSREYHWSAAYEFFNDPYYRGDEWSVVNDGRNGAKIGEVYRTVEIYNWEKEQDCSKETSITFYKPTKLISEGLGLQFSRIEGELLDASGERTCFDPSVTTKCISSLLVRKDKLMAFLEANNLSLFWGVVGEKQINARSWAEGEYPGRMNMSGLFSLENGNIEGALNTEME